MMEETVSLLSRIDREIEVSPLSLPMGQEEICPPLKDGYVRRTAKQGIRYDPSYFKKRKRRIILTVAAAAVVILVVYAFYAVGEFRL